MENELPFEMQRGQKCSVNNEESPVTSPSGQPFTGSLPADSKLQLQSRLATALLSTVAT